MQSNRTGHNDQTFTNESLFFLGTIPQLPNATKNPTPTNVQWGFSPLNFTINVTDIDNDTVTITLWIKNSTGNFFNENETTCTNCQDFEFTTWKNFSNESVAANPWDFKFNATDFSNVGDNETATTTFNITKDNINFTNITGNNAIVNRSESSLLNVTNLSAIVFDLILSANTLITTTPTITLTEITFRVFNGTETATNSTEEIQNGTFNYIRQFNPGCSYQAGNQDWYIEVNNSGAYTDNSSLLQKIQIFADVNSSFIEPTATNNANEFEVGTTARLIGKLRDDCLTNITAANVLYELKADTREVNRPTEFSNNTNGFGYAQNLALAFDNNLNDTTTFANISSNQSANGDFAQANYTYKINTTFTEARLFITTAKNTTGIAGSISIYNFTLGDFQQYVIPTVNNPTTQTNQTTLTTKAGQINGSGHIIIQANATADGTDRSTIFLYDTAIHTPRYYTCGSVTNSTGNTYGCNFDTTGKAVGNYNITMTGFKNFHNNGTNFTLNGIKIKSSPILANGTINIASEGWGAQRTFTVNVTDNAGDTVTVKAFEDITGSGDFIEIGEQTCTSCASTTLTFTSIYLCSEIRDSNTFKFNATDTEGNSDETTTGTFDIKKDNVRIDLITGNSSNSTLNTPALFVVRIFDYDNNTFNLTSTATVTFNVTKTGPGTDFTLVDTNDTNSTGHTPFNFLADKSFNTDKQNWLAYTNTQTCYLTNQSSTFNVTTLTNTPQLTNETQGPPSAGWGVERFFNITVSDTHNNATISLWEAATTSGPWTLLGTQGYNYTERIQRHLIHDASTTPDTGFNYTETINLTGNVSTFNITIYNTNETTNFSFNITVNQVLILSNITAINRTNISIDVHSNITINAPGNNTINITVFNSTEDVVPLKYLAYADYFLTNVQRDLNFSINLTKDHAIDATWVYKFNATNTIGNTNTTLETTLNNFTVNKDTLQFQELTGNNSIANRTGPITDVLYVRVFDQDNGTFVEGINVSFTLTLDGTTEATAFKNETNSTGYSTYAFNPACSPKNEIGDQDWKIQILSESLYNDLTLDGLNLSVRGDIQLVFTKPDGTKNFTQEDIIDFLGATTDDCGTALLTTVLYIANTTGSTSFFTCDNTTQVGANAFTCDLTTNITTTQGYYNTTMRANATNHYNNETTKTATPGLFFLNPIKKLQSPTSTPTIGGWGITNWNLSVVASSGDATNDLNVTLFMGLGTPNPSAECISPTCQNQTNTTCINCQDKTTYWLRNFTSDTPSTDLIGDWFFQFKLNDSGPTSTSGTANTITVRKDATNITYNQSNDGLGNSTTVTYLTNPQTLKVRVFDKDKNSNNVTPGAIVTFKLIDTFYTNNELIIGSNTTNSSGHAQFTFNLTTCDVKDGAQIWQAQINNTEPNYNNSESPQLNITLDRTGCVGTVTITKTITPKETLQNIPFVINACILVLLLLLGVGFRIRLCLICLCLFLLLLILCRLGMFGCRRRMLLWRMLWCLFC